MSSTLSISLSVLDSSAPSTPCVGCHAGCCRAQVVPLTGGDIFRIVTQLKVPFWKFVSRWADASCAISRGVAPHFFFNDDRRTPYVIGLLQTESRVFPGTRKCGFLGETTSTNAAPQGTGRCLIYEHRPLACRIFPSSVDEAGDMRALAVQRSPPELRHAVYDLCPHPWSISDIDPAAALQDLRDCADEMERFHAIAHRWNDQPGPWPMFPDFLELIYTALARSDAGSV